MELLSSQMSRLRDIELDMLRYFIRACETLNLRYYVIGGTLLGAVRHKGFIPWDDDIDLGMPRADYEILVQKGQALFPEHIFLQTHHTEKNYLQNFMKIRNSETTFIETATKNRKINHGVFIDVFPLDGYTQDEQRRKEFQKKNDLYIERIIEELYRENVSLRARCTEIVVKLMYPSVRSVLEKRDRLFKSMPDEELWANHCGAWGEKEIIPAEWYAEGTMLEFEGIQVRAPKDYDKWLTKVYGDYMQLPPVEKRVTHHDTEVIDLDVSYKRYIKL